VGRKSAEEGVREWGEAEKSAVWVIGVKEGSVLQKDLAEPLQEA